MEPIKRENNFIKGADRAKIDKVQFGTRSGLWGKVIKGIILWLKNIPCEG